ncbi:hypothetical protein WOLCODRAFT_140209 [Wolfiporia cocos MD-104 SS10]|uniref:Uncharacterized protein n=1 Tax=Wolfiporia cocos (strain MD-104) TaxID=742152 RepID=A0A2H3J254_WOLCO|nr:hypothetical protein WOLCODRAFT_140209 [Wolfiporia cocos MD-104 SS10]
MAKGEITPFPLNIPSSDRPSTSASSAVSPSSVATRPSSFSLPGPVQRLLDFGSSPERDMASQSHSAAEQAPILTVKLSGPSFLDTVIRDTSSKEPIYIIETVRDLTTIYRLDSRIQEAGKAATIQWPPNVVAGKGKGRSGKSVQMGGGSWRDADELLKVGALGNLASRKFNLPYYPHSLKWKFVPNNAYVCTTSGIKGPIAVLDAAVLSAPPRLRIYETLIMSEHARSQRNHAGVPFLLLDYLVATSLLLTTTTQEWLDRAGDQRIPGSSSRTVQKWLAVIHPPTLAPGDEGDEKRKEEQPERTADSEPISPATQFSGSSGGSSTLWDTHTTASSSNSGSGTGSERGFAPLTPATTVSTQSSSAFFGRQDCYDDPPPPLPEPPQLSRFRIANPEPSPDYYASTSTDGDYPHLASYPGSPPQSATTVASLVPRASSSDLASTRRIRQLPTPPVQQDAQRYAPPPEKAQAAELSRVMTSPASSSYSSYPNPPPTPGFSDSFSHRAAARMSVRSLRSIPPAPPPPQNALPLPLPPKLQSEYDRGEGSGHHRSHSMNEGHSRDASALAHGMAGLSVNSEANPPLSPPPPFPAEHARPSSSGTVHLDAGRVRASFAHADRGAETDSVYEMPPPAYDAIDFSLRVNPPKSRRRGR